MVHRGLRAAVRIVALLNVAYFGLEFAVAVAIGSVSLFADGVDFLEDASVNLLILLAFNWSALARARVGLVLAGVRRSGPHGRSWAPRPRPRRCRYP